MRCDAARRAGDRDQLRPGVRCAFRAAPENLAYSDLGLGLHTDNPYRDPVPGFQALHALLSSPDGGDSVFADGFALAEHLRAIDSDDSRSLPNPVPFHYRSKNAELYAERPLIQLSCRGEVTAVHYNSRSIAPLCPASRDVTRILRGLPALRRNAARAGLQLRFGSPTVSSSCSTISASCTAARRFLPRSMRAIFAAVILPATASTARPRCCGGLSTREKCMAVTDEILGLFQDRGAEAYFGESVSMMEHACRRPTSRPRRARLPR